MSWLAYLRSLWATVGFLSIFPAGRKWFLEPDDFKLFPAFYPVVGLIFGLILFLIWILSALFLPPQTSALLVVTVLVVLNRGFHLDGLADAADALFSHKSRARKLEIMKDSRQGTFGVLAIVLDILLKMQIVAVAAPQAPWVLILWPVWGRVAASVVAVSGAYVGQDNGLGRWMVEKSGLKEFAVAAVFTLIVSCFGLWPTIITALASILMGCFFSWVWRKTLGGVTGDLLGATIELTEIASLFIFCLLLN